MILGSGLDLIEVSRFERESARRGVGLFEEVFTPAERLQWGALSRPARGFAMGWAAKEACWKALGTGKIDAMAWHDIEVNWTPPSHPAVTLRGDTAAAAEHRGVTRIVLSLACTKTRAVAWALIQGPGIGDQGSEYRDRGPGTGYDTHLSPGRGMGTGDIHNCSPVPGPRSLWFEWRS